MPVFPASLLILNGKGANEPQLREAIALLREEGVDIHVRVTWEKGDAVRFVDEALQLKVGTVIAGGGDGTINAAGGPAAHRSVFCSAGSRYTANIRSGRRYALPPCEPKAR